MDREESEKEENQEMIGQYTIPAKWIKYGH